MDEKQKRLFAILTQLIGGGPNELKDDVLKEIHSCYDRDLHKALDNWFESKSSDGQPLTVGQVMATVAYFMAHTIYEDCEDNDEICIITQAYGDYIHQSAHAIFNRYGVGPDVRMKKKNL